MPTTDHTALLRKCHHQSPAYFQHSSSAVNTHWFLSRTVRAATIVSVADDLVITGNPPVGDGLPHSQGNAALFNSTISALKGQADRAGCANTTHSDLISFSFTIVVTLPERAAMCTLICGLFCMEQSESTCPTIQIWSTLAVCQWPSETLGLWRHWFVSEKWSLN